MSFEPRLVIWKADLNSNEAIQTTQSQISDSRAISGILPNGRGPASSLNPQQLPFVRYRVVSGTDSALKMPKVIGLRGRNFIKEDNTKKVKR